MCWANDRRMHLHLCISINRRLAMVLVKDLRLYQTVNKIREACRCKLDHTGFAAVSGLNTALHAHHCCHLLGCHHSLDHLCAPPQQTASGMSVTTSAHTLKSLHVCPLCYCYAKGLWPLHAAHITAFGQADGMQMAVCKAPANL